MPPHAFHGHPCCGTVPTTKNGGARRIWTKPDARSVGALNTTSSQANSRGVGDRLSKKVVDHLRRGLAALTRTSNSMMPLAMTPHCGSHTGPPPVPVDLLATRCGTQLHATDRLTVLCWSRQLPPR